MNSLLTAEQRQKAEQKSQPDWIGPTLAKLTHDHFSDAHWIYERKLDGVRCLIFAKEGKVRLLSRNRKEQNEIYPELVTALEKQSLNFIADGEIVTFDGNLTSFSTLQNRVNTHNPSQELIDRYPLYFYLFDLMYIEGYDIRNLTQRERKKILKKALTFKDPVRYCSHINEKGMDYFRQACQKGWEGVIAKDAEQPYKSGRNRNWLKFKCVNQQEFVIGGYTEPQGERIGFGALLVGYYDDDKLIYAGKVGTGYSDQQLQELHDQLSDIEQSQNPFNEPIGDEQPVHWVKPTMVGEFDFMEWTDDKKLRHPAFKGLRHDKEAREVTKE